MISLREGAERLVRVCANVQPDEEVLILTDDNKLEIAQAVQRYIIDDLKGTVILTVMPMQKVNGEEPLPSIAAAMSKADVILCLNTFSLSQTDARVAANNAGAQILNFPAVERSDLTERLIQCDFAGVAPYIKEVANRLQEGCAFRVTAPGGTDLVFDGTGRIGRGLDALVHEKGVFRSMSVEANIGPLEGTAQEMFVVDGSIPEVGPLDAPIRCTIKDGRIIKIEGGEKAALFEKVLRDLDDPLIYCVGEFGIGMNPRAILTGNSYLEDESAISTCHIGFGTNLSQGGTIKAKGHIDAIVKAPTIEIDGKLLMKDGEFVDIPIKPVKTQ